MNDITRRVSRTFKGRNCFEFSLVILVMRQQWQGREGGSGPDRILLRMRVLGLRCMYLRWIRLGVWVIELTVNGRGIISKVEMPEVWKSGTLPRLKVILASVGWWDMSTRAIFSN